jgi:hypothetical protein
MILLRNTMSSAAAWNRIINNGRTWRERIANQPNVAIVKSFRTQSKGDPVEITMNNPKLL